MSHETLFKRVFRQTRNARGELAAAMPREIAEGLAWETLRAEPAEFVDPSLRRHYADLIFSVAGRDRATRVYLLFEHKSGCESFTSLQLLRYLVQIQEWWRRDHRDAVDLPVIVPVVVYHGEKPWQAPRNVVDLFGEEARRFRPDTLLFPYPNPKAIGLVMDPKEAARVKDVRPGSAAAKSGLRAGDEITTLDGQPMLSTADIQWVLHGAAESATLAAEVARGGETVKLSLELAAGWRARDDISWRATTWDLRRMVTGGLVLVDLAGEERTTAGLAADSLALRVQHVGQYGEHATGKKAGFQKDDIVVAVAGDKRRRTESELIAFLLGTTKPGDSVELRVRRQDKELELQLPMR